MDPISIAWGIASFAAPRLAKWLGGDKAEDVANQVVGIAQSVTGVDNGSAALTALKSNPEAVIEFQRQIGELEVRLYEEETKRLVAVNETIRAESASNDPYVRRWRPTFGYAMAVTWTIQTLVTGAGILASVIWRPSEAGVIIMAIAEANAATVPMWAVALSVIGVSVYQRSKDKRSAAGGEAGAGLFGALAQRIAGTGSG